ncbi:hypothetical protein [Rubritalea tangerina]|uniref:hypothetical protein n=1 Tax=Rubritalea tangerina TaxID=430798 RepID=UPI00360D39FF
MIYCLRIGDWKRGAKLNRGQRLGAASCSTKLMSRLYSDFSFSMISLHGGFMMNRLFRNTSPVNEFTRSLDS